MGPYARFVRRFSGERWFSWTAARIAPSLDRTVHRLTGGRYLATPSSIPTLLLTTIGRRSGEPRTVPLSFVVDEGVEHVVGTNFGQSHHPAWALNLLHTPRAEVSFRSASWAVEAVPVPGGRHHELWPLFDAIVPAYRAYRERVDRPIHMFRLERA